MKQLWVHWHQRRRWQKIVIAFGALIILAGIGVYFWLFPGLPSLDRLQAGLALPSTHIYDRQGRLLYEIIDPHGGQNTALPIDQIPKVLQQATIDTEDRNFYAEPLGIDLTGMVRAAWIDLRGGDVQSGGSTITQQVARNLLLDPQSRSERTVTRKLRELILAIRLTQAYSHDQILALYLNQTYYGNLAYGVQAAAQVYFGQNADSLDLAQAALLAGLPQAPALYDPLTNPDAARTRQQTVLRLMVQAGDINQTQADDAAKEPLQFASGRYPIEAPHFVLGVWDELAQKFPDALYQGGLQVTTTLNLDWQHTAENIVKQQLSALNQPSDIALAHHATDGALVALDPHTGQILALVGSADYFDKGIDGAVDMARAPRQPGSALKPFTYSLAFDPTHPDAWTPSTILYDISTPFVTRKLESYTPANFGLVEHGLVPIREALANSYNIPAVITLDHVGVPALVELLHKLGISTLTDPSTIDLSITLGGGAVRLIDLTGAYTTFANGGAPATPTDILEVRDQAGKVLYQWQPPTPQPPLIDPRVTFLINSILSDNDARQPEFGNHSALQIGRIAAAKTGTTTDFRDNWTIGYTPDLTVGVWVGNADNTPMVNVSGVSGAGPIWNQFMRAVLADTPDKPFPQPPGVHQATVCALSGLLPTPLCPKTRADWFIDSTEPTQPDNVYQQFVIDRQSGLLASDQTPPGQRVTKVYAVLPQEAQAWAVKHGFPQPPTTFAPNSSGVAQAPTPANATPNAVGETLRLLSPDPYTIFQLTPLVPLDTQQIRLTAAVPKGTVKVEYQIDGQSIGSVDSAPWGVWWTLTPGAHNVVAIATLADNSTRSSDPVPFRVVNYVPPDARPTAGDVGNGNN